MRPAGTIMGSSYDSNQIDVSGFSMEIKSLVYGLNVTTSPDNGVNSYIWNYNTNGTLTAPGGITAPSFTGSLFGTSSYAAQANSASFASTASYLNPISNSYVILSQVSSSLNFVDDNAAAVGGVPLGGLYRNGNFILIRVGGSVPTLFSGTITWGFSDPCAFPDGTVTGVTGNGTTYCNSTEIYSPDFVSLMADTYYTANGGQLRTTQFNGTSTASFQDSCTACS